ncbi:hypothetical protein JKI95_03590 [Corynebacterium aquatimens]|uniref:hypothetical protein n=1 Tax=Corynebacterium aquatimens TaxID=1190508 RepID=UPI0025418F3B|nr:hypothetical protein [Corynebacterium aquatimens]QYH20098.1 hypothetical protein JKI95_03590 [Corynebacterium aquatimens]
MSTFQDALAGLTDEQLRTLITTRPDAFFPIPPSIGALASRLALPASMHAALHSLNAADLIALEGLADRGAELSSVDATEGRTAGSLGDLTRLRERALIYGPDTAVRIAPGTLSALPPGWRIGDTAPDNVADLVRDLPALERRVLDTLAASSGLGTTRAAAPGADPATPVARLITKQLLARVDDTTVRLPARSAT